MTREELSHKTKDEIIDIYLNQMDEYGRRIAALTQTIADLKETLEEFKRMIFASKSERESRSFRRRSGANTAAMRPVMPTS